MNYEHISLHHAMVNSVKQQRTVAYLCKVGDNRHLFYYNGKYCYGIFNPFVCLYYVDDLYAVEHEEFTVACRFAEYMGVSLNEACDYLRYVKSALSKLEEQRNEEI